jgi:hypothetical protein
LQEHRGVHLAAAVDADVEQVLVVELEVEPRAPVRDDAGRVEQLARRVGLALVVVEEHARRTVELRHDHALGAVDDEGAVVGHQRDLAEVDLLLLRVAERLVSGLVGVEGDQRIITLIGAAKVMPRLRHSSTSYFGASRW